MTDEEFKLMKQEVAEQNKVEGFNKKVMIFDTVFTLVMVALMLSGLVGANICFGVGLMIMMLINYPNSEARYEYISRQSGPLSGIAITMFGLAYFLGITTSTGCFNDLIELFLGNMPESMLIHVPLIICIFSTILMIFVGNPVAAILIPAVGSLTASLGVDTMKFMVAYFCCQVFSINLCLFAATPFLALNLAEVSVKDQIKYSTAPCLLAGVIQAFACVAIGLIPF